MPRPQILGPCLKLACSLASNGVGVLVPLYITEASPKMNAMPEYGIRLGSTVCRFDSRDLAFY